MATRKEIITGVLWGSDRPNNPMEASLLADRIEAALDKAAKYRLDDVKADLAEIERVAKGDDEGAHAREDLLHTTVLETIAFDYELKYIEAREMAKLALTSENIKFGRHCS